ncbi:unnamed protein product, partial [Mesorhabditis spiculigera]
MSHAASYKLVLAVSLFLLFAGLILTALSLFSSQWQIAEVPWGHVTHQHGVVKDCIEPSPGLIPLHQTAHTAHRCVYKFDPAAEKSLMQALSVGDEESQEVLLHRFLPQHKSVVFFSVFVFVFGLLSAIIGVCSPCFPPNSILFVGTLFLTAGCSILADVIFIAASIKPPRVVWNKYSNFDPAKYQSKLGIAAFVHLLASGLIATAFVSSLGATYLLLMTRNRKGAGCCSQIRTKARFQEEDRWPGPGMMIRACDDASCRPFVIMPDPQSDDS